MAADASKLEIKRRSGSGDETEDSVLEMLIFEALYRMQRKDDQWTFGYLSLKFKRNVMAEDIIWESSAYIGK